MEYYVGVLFARSYDRCNQMRGRWVVVNTWLAAGLLSFISGAAQRENASGASALAAILLILISVAFAFRCFKTSPNKDVVWGIIGIAGMPILMAVLLSLNGTELNVHTTAILFIPYFLVSEAAAGVLTVALIVRVVRARVTERENG